MFQMMTGRPSPYARMPYNPQAVDKLKMGIQSRKDKAITAMDEARKKDLETAEEERRARIPLIQEERRLASDRASMLEKAGATAKIPKADNVKAVEELIKHDYDILPDDAHSLARPVAERMEELMRR